ncbi:2-C-methyl-D-erythritol 4-phosphate cytidylyltransferase [Mariniluteicoccus endophyticus]
MNTDTPPVVALVAAAGSGSRLGAAVPKALVELAGVPLVRRSVDQLADAGVQRVVVTIPQGLDAEFTAALDGTAAEVTLVVGGAERQESVRRGLAACAGARIVLVHDAARPLVPVAVVRAVIDAVADGHVAVVPAMPVVDSVRRVDGEGSSVVDRTGLFGVQTPQGFDLASLAEAHRVCAERGLVVTDDAAACEALGHRVHLVPGSRHAMKVTEPFDLVVAEALVAG